VGKPHRPSVKPFPSVSDTETHDKRSAKVHVSQHSLDSRQQPAPDRNFTSDSSSTGNSKGERDETDPSTTPILDLKNQPMPDMGPSPTSRIDQNPKSSNSSSGLSQDLLSSSVTISSATMEGNNENRPGVPTTGGPSTDNMEDKAKRVEAKKSMQARLEQIVNSDAADSAIASSSEESDILGKLPPMSFYLFSPLPSSGIPKLTKLSHSPYRSAPHSRACSCGSPAGFTAPWVRQVRR
jgi:hypothetical protein